MISFACPKCGKPLRVKEELAGKKLKCPAGDHVVHVPAQSQVTSSAEETSSETVSLPSADKELCSFLAPAQKPDELGRLGNYRILKVLGVGGMGVVFLGEDLALKRQVALKAMLPNLAATSARQRFIREAQLAAQIEHDHVVPIYQVGQDRGIPFIAMPLLKGQPLDDLLKDKGRLPIAQVLRIGRDTALGLAAAHAKGLVHRDIKPANLWLEAGTNRVKILDFGLVRSTEGSSQLTQSNAILGTPAYMAPEQASNKAIDGRCDLFSLGCVLYRLSTGVLPFKGNDPLATLMAVATEDPETPHTLQPDVPPRLSGLIMRLLEKDPKNRPASAQKVADLLVSIEQGNEPTVAPERPREARSRKRWLVPALVGTLLLAGLGIGTAVLLQGGKNDPPNGDMASHDKDTTKDRDDIIPPSDKDVEPAKDKLPFKDNFPVKDKEKDKIVPKKDKKGPNPAAAHERAVAEWAIGLVGEVGIDGDRFFPIKSKADLPKKMFHVTSINLDGKISVRDGDLNRLFGLAKLEVLGLDGTGVTDAGLAHVKDLATLTTLRLGQTAIGEEGLAQLKGLRKLHTLTLSKTKISSKSLASISGLPEMKILNLSNTKVDDSGMAHLKSLKKLKSLNVAHTKITDKGLNALHTLIDLTFIDLTADEVSPAGIASLQKALPNVKLRR